jgi:dihydrofolate reductase
LHLEFLTGGIISLTRRDPEPIIVAGGPQVVLEIVYYVAASLDGYIATPDGGIAWLESFEGTGEDYGYAAFYASVEALLLGSRTYEQVLTFGWWPYAGKPCWVFSRRPLEAARPDLIVSSRGPREVALELEARGIRRAWLVGGGQLAAAFQAEELITEYIVSIIPTILGAGIPLFGVPAPDRRALPARSLISVAEPLALAGHNVYANGVVQLRYARGQL